MKKKQVNPLLGKVFQKVAPKIGARVLMEPEWGMVGQVTFGNGRKRYFRYSSLDLNPLGASEIAKDKDFANFFMKKMGYPTIPGKTFFSEDWAKAIGSNRSLAAAYRYAKTLGFPVVVKPNSGSQGKGVAFVHTRREFERALRVIFKQDRVALVQRPVSGNDYRVVVLDARVISAYQRIPLNVTGDGRTTVQGLLKRKQRAFIASSRDTQLKIDDPRIKDKLERQGLSMGSVLRHGQKIYLLDNANLSTGGDSVDVTKTLHPDFAKLAVRLTEDMGLRLCGVDLMVSGEISKKPGKFWILEINSAPGLDHYAKSGRAQQKIVEDLYLEVLKSMER
ncbi:cyanophycin synthetase [Candidatus Parcubacteria bacterium]|nr:cyanophycin synthetase [Candidatus Parcubacteria bacterium]